MGVLKLLPMLQSVTDQVHISKYAGKVVGIDAAGWILKGAYSCAADVVQDKSADGYLSYCLRQIKLLKKFEITPLFVFDGAPLPANAETDAARNNGRMGVTRNELGLLELREADSHKPLSGFSRPISVTNQMTRKLMDVLRRIEIPFYVAPYAANAQLAYLSRIKMVDAVITENSDIVPLGCKKVLLKWKEDGWASELQRRSLGANEDFSFVGWTEEMFIQFCVLSGCDYCPSVPGVEVNNAYKLVQEFRRPQDVIEAIKHEKQGALPGKYAEKYYKAILTFRHQLVFDPRDQKLKPLNPLKLSEDILELVDKDLLFLGVLDQPDEVVASLSRGLMDPITHESYAWEEQPVRLIKGLSADILETVQSMTSSESSKRTIDWGNDQASSICSSIDDSAVMSRNGFSESEHIKKQRIALQLKRTSHDDKPSSSWAHLESVLGPSTHILNFRSPKVSDNFKSLVESHSVIPFEQVNTTATQMRDFETQPVRKNLKRVRNPRNRKRDDQASSGFEGEISCHVTASSKSDRISQFEAAQHGSQEEPSVVKPSKTMILATEREIPLIMSSPLLTTDASRLFLPPRGISSLRGSDQEQPMFPWAKQPKAASDQPVSPLSSYSRASYVEDKWDRILLAEEASNEDSDDEDG